MAQKESSKLIIVDLEALCWEEVRPDDDKEIIEIGMCLLDVEKKKIERSNSYIVRPRNLEVSPFCTQLTGHTKEGIIKDGRPLREVLNTIRHDYPLSSHVWGSWGFYDRNKLHYECLNKAIQNPFGQEHFNLKTLHAMINGLKKGIGLGVALRNYGMAFEGREHSAVDDSINTAKVVLKMFSRN